MLCARRLLSCAFYRTRETIAYHLCYRCEWIKTSSYLNHLQAQFACSTTLFGKSAPSIRHHLSLVANKPEKPENTDKSSVIAERFGQEDFTEDTTSPEPRQGSYVRKDNLKWQKSPWRVKQLRFSRHIGNLVRKGKMEEAHKVFEQMKKGKVHTDVAVYNTLIAGYGREGNVQTCFKLFNEMKKRFLLPTDHTYSSMFAACAAAGPRSSEILNKVQEEIERRSVLLNTIPTNALITALVKCGRHDDARDIYTSMVNKNANPDPHTFSSLLLAAAHDREGGFGAGQRAWSEMIASGVQPDLHCFNMLLQCVRDSGISSSILEGVAEKRRSITLKLNLVNFDDNGSSVCQEDSVTVKLYASGVADFSLGDGSKLRVHLGHVEGNARGVRGPTIRWLETEDVEMLFTLLKKLKLQPNIMTFQILARLSFDPSFLMREMAKLKRKGVIPDRKFMVAVIKMQTLLGNLTGAKLLLNYARGANLNMSQHGYQAIASSCMEEKDGLKLLQEMIDCSVLPNVYVFGTLLGNAARSRNYEYLTALLKKMLHFEVVPNNFILEILETAAHHDPHGVRQAKRLNGFKGYYKIWKGVMVPQGEQEDDQNVNMLMKD